MPAKEMPVKMKVRYCGTAAGQAEEIAVGGMRFVRGFVYQLDAADVERCRLLTRGGFELAEDSAPAQAPAGVVTLPLPELPASKRNRSPLRAEGGV